MGCRRVVLLIILIAFLMESGEMLVVGGSREIWVPADYSTIQNAINAAEAGDTIFVSSGTYFEHVFVNKSVALKAVDGSSTIIDGNGTGNVVTVSAHNVNITGFTLRNSGPDKAGVHLLRASGCSLVNNIISNCSVGIKLDYSNNNKIEGNIITHCDSGVRLWYMATNNNLIRNNTLSNNGNAVDLRTYSHGTSIIENRIENNTFGVYVSHSENNNIERNIILGNTFWGIYLFGGRAVGNVVMYNNIEENGGGISIWFSTNNTITFNNFVNNVVHASVLDPNSRNVWSAGYPVGGNYWSDYAGEDRFEGPYQNVTGGDGIGDVPFVINEKNIDWYPLVEPIVIRNGPDVSDVWDFFSLIAAAVLLIMIVAVVLAVFVMLRRVRQAKEVEKRVKFFGDA